MRSLSANRRAGCSGAEGRTAAFTLEPLERRQMFAAAVGGGGGTEPVWFAAVAEEPSPVVVREGSAPQEWLVQLTPAAAQAFGDPAAADRALSAAVPGVRVIRGLGAAGQLLVTADAEVAAVNRLRELPEVAFLESNGLATSAAREPDDPRYQDGSQWGLSNRGLLGGLIGADIDASTAWELTPGSPDVVIAVIDGGVDISHPDLVANVWRNSNEVPGNGIDDDGNGFVDDVYGWDFQNRNGSVFDVGDNDHGTQVAGIIAARGDNGLGVVGVSWNSKIMPLKFIGSGGGSTADAIAALNYTTMMRQRGENIRVVNLSWGSSDSSWLLERAIEDAGRAGILVVASAGNSGLNQDTAWSPNYPSSFGSTNILAVAATDNRDRLAYDSNYGLARVDLAAPGVGILSTTPGRRYSSNSGTSFAAPFVSGVAALAAAINPSLSAVELRNVILAGVEPVPSLAGKVATGGRLNAAHTLAAVIETDPTYAGREFLAAPEGATLVDSRSRVGPRHMVTRGPGLIVIEGTNQHSGGTLVESGVLVLRNRDGLGSGGLEVADGGSLILDVGFAVTLVSQITMSGSASIDLGRGKIVVAGGVDEATLRAWIVAGRTSGGESGMRSSAVTDASRTIGYTINATGETSGAFTAPGDSDLDRDVDVLDLIAIQSAGRFGTGAQAGWMEGDVNYDGHANVFDLVAIQAAGSYGKGSVETQNLFASQPKASSTSQSRGTGGEGDFDLAGRGRSIGSGGWGGAGIKLGSIDAGAGFEIRRERERFPAGLLQLQLSDTPFAPSLLALDDSDRHPLRAADIELESRDAVGFVRRAPHASATTDRLTYLRSDTRIRFEFLHNFDHERMLGQAAAAGAEGSDDDNERKC
jgi:autotransporter-associated beta strand protein